MIDSQILEKTVLAITSENQSNVSTCERKTFKKAEDNLGTECLGPYDMTWKCQVVKNIWFIAQPYTDSEFLKRH